MNKGALRGVTVGLTGPLARTGGSWGGNRGRINADELRMWNNNDDAPNVNNHGGGRYFRNNAQVHASSLSYPGDLGSVINIGTGNFVMGGGVPWSGAFNTAGTFLFNQNSSSNGSVFENDTVFSNFTGQAQTVPAMSTLIAGTTYIADGALATFGVNPYTDCSSNLIYSITNGGTWSVGTIYNFRAHVFMVAGVTTTQRSGFRNEEDQTDGTMTTQVGFDSVFMKGATNNYGLALGLNQTITFSVNPGGSQIAIGPGATVTLDFASATSAPFIQVNPTVLINQSASAVGLANVFNHVATYRNVSTAAANFGPVTAYNSAMTIGPDTQTGLVGATSTDFRSAPTYSQINSGTITSLWAHIGFRSAFTLNATGSTVATRTGFGVLNATLTAGTLTTQIGLDIAALSGAGSNIGIRLGDGGTDIATGTSTGSMFGMTTSQKIGFLGATPIIQQANSVDIAAVLTNFGFRATGGNPPLNLGTGALTAGATALGATTTTSLAATLAVTSSGATNGVGYATGAGGTATQLTSKTTAFPTISKVCGTLTWNNAALAASTSVTSGSSTNTAIAATDTVVFNHISGGTLGAYTMTCTPGAGSWTLSLRNVSTGSLSEAPVFAFSIIKAVTS